MTAARVMRRFGGTAPGGGVTLPAFHPAARSGRTIFSSRVFDPDEVQRVLRSGQNSRKIGALVDKGRWRGMPIVTLTLEERATCPRTCLEWRRCYGNNMQAAERITAGIELEVALTRELQALQARHPAGFVVRLHVLGDFYSAGYVEHWATALQRYPALRIFGFTAWGRGTPIGDAITAMADAHVERVAMRISGLDAAAGGAVTVAPGETTPHILCPAQSDPDRCCGTCALCWQTTRTIAFRRH